MIQNNQVIFFDTTLRDGEQSPGCSMNLEEKIRVAEELDKLGVDVIEAGFAIASQGDFEAISEISQLMKHAAVASLSRANEKDIHRAWQAIKAAKNPRIHTFISTSALHMKYKLQMSPELVLEKIHHSVSYARHLCEDVEWSAEDASRTESDFLCRAIETAITAGARTINLPDTVGYATPESYGAMFKMVMERVPNIDKAILSVHCHNDLGMAVANSLAGIIAGARQVECTINGIGERAGNAALEEIVMAMRTRSDHYSYQNNIVTEHIMSASRTLSAVTSFPVQPNKAIIGANAFAHEAGIHQDGMLKNAQTYEIMTPESVGLTRSTFVMGKHSGRHAFKSKLSDLGYSLSHDELDDAFKRFKDLADKKKQVFDEDILVMIDEQIASSNERISFDSLSIQCGSVGPQKSKIILIIDGQKKEAEAEGSGPIDATFKAIKMIFPHEVELQLYQVHAVTEGIDAQAEVTVRLQAEGKSVTGQGSDVDTMVASARAYLHALNKWLDKSTKTAPESLIA